MEPDPDLSSPVTPTDSATIVAYAHSLVTEVRAHLKHNACILLWKESILARAFSLASLSHQCVLLDHMSLGVEQDFAPPVMALMCRSVLETWITGMYLLGGGQSALDTFLGETTTRHRQLQQAVEDLHRNGRFLDLEIPTLEDFDWDEKRWNFETAAIAIDRLAAGLLTGSGAQYRIVYRALSGLHGAHPSHRFLDGYVDAARLLAHVRESWNGSLRGPLALLYGASLTAVHSAFAFAERGLDVSNVTRIYVALRDLMPDNVPGSRSSGVGADRHPH